MADGSLRCAKKKFHCIRIFFVIFFSSKAGEKTLVSLTKVCVTILCFLCSSEEEYVS